jgi:putative glutamine amidotransferase
MSLLHVGPSKVQTLARAAVTRMAEAPDDEAAVDIGEHTLRDLVYESRRFDGEKVLQFSRRLTLPSARAMLGATLDLVAEDAGDPSGIAGVAMAMRRQPHADEAIDEIINTHAHQWVNQMQGSPRCVIGVVCDSAHAIWGPDGDVKAYAQGALQAGGVPRLLAACGGDLARQMERCDALLLPGGIDVHPEMYGEDVRPGSMNGFSTNREFDRFSIAAIRAAWATSMPMLGICRGLQLLNVAMEGTLLQDIEREHQRDRSSDYVRHRANDGRRYGPSHHVNVQPGTRLSTLMEARPMVNSTHHQAVGKLSPHLVISATAPDGVVEGIERPGDSFQLAVQFHPEPRGNGSVGYPRLFQELVAHGEAWHEAKWGPQP